MALSVQEILNGGPSASVKIDKELQICDCLDVWTDPGVTVTASADATYFREGTTSALLHMEAALTTGIVGYDTGSLANNDLSGGDYSHIAFEVRSSIARAAGDFQIGFDDSATFNTAYGAGVRVVDLPAIPAATVANPWYTVCLPLSAGQLALTSVSSVGIWAILTQLNLHSDLYIDNIRLMRIVPTGDAAITIPTIHSVENANGDTDRVTLFAFPFKSRLLATNPAPLALELVPFRGEAAGAWAATDPEQGHVYLETTEYLDDSPRSYTALAIKRATELTGVQKITLEVLE